MKHAFILITGLLVLGAAGSLAVTTPGTPEFERYRVILDKHIFREITPAETAAAATATSAPTESLTRDLEMKAIVDLGNSLSATFMDKKTNKYFSLQVGERNDPYELVSINYDNEEAVLKKGAETTIFYLKPNKTSSGTNAIPKLPFGGGGPRDFTPLSPIGTAPAQGFTPVTSADSKKPFFSDMKKRKFSPFKPLGTNAPTPFQTQSLENFMKANTNPMMGFPGQARPFQPVAGTNKGDTIDGFMRANPSASSHFSPLKPTAPNTAATPGQGATIEGFLTPNQDQVQPPAAPFFPEPAPEEDSGEAEE